MAYNGKVLEEFKRTMARKKELMRKLRYRPEKLYAKEPNFWIRPIHNSIVQKEVNDIIKSSKPKSLLEVGPGMHPITSENFAGSRVFIDTASEVFKSGEYEKTRGDKVRGKMQGMPFKNDSFDMAVLSSVFFHVPQNQIKKSVKELARTAKELVIFEVALEKEDERLIVENIKKEGFEVEIKRDIGTRPEHGGFIIHARRKLNNR